MRHLLHIRCLHWKGQTTKTGRNTTVSVRPELCACSIRKSRRRNSNLQYWKNAKESLRLVFSRVKSSAAFRKSLSLKVLPDCTCPQINDSCILVTCGCPLPFPTDREYRVFLESPTR